MYDMRYGREVHGNVKAFLYGAPPYRVVLKDGGGATV
jgi:hypothetical protein